jgi:hypothetical protein
MIFELEMKCVFSEGITELFECIFMLQRTNEGSCTQQATVVAYDVGNIAPVQYVCITWTLQQVSRRFKKMRCFAPYETRQYTVSAFFAYFPYFEKKKIKVGL